MTFGPLPNMITPIHHDLSANTELQTALLSTGQRINGDAR